MQQIVREHQAYPPKIVASVTSWELWKTLKGKDLTDQCDLVELRVDALPRNSRLNRLWSSGRRCPCWSPCAAMRKEGCAASRKKSALPYSGPICRMPPPWTLKSRPCATPGNWLWKRGSGTSSSSAPPMISKSLRVWITCANRKKGALLQGGYRQICIHALPGLGHPDRSTAFHQAQGANRRHGNGAHGPRLPPALLSTGFLPGIWLPGRRGNGPRAMARLTH